MRQTDMSPRWGLKKVLNWFTITISLLTELSGKLAFMERITIGKRRNMQIPWDEMFIVLGLHNPSNSVEPARSAELTTKPELVEGSGMWRLTNMSPRWGFEEGAQLGRL